MQAIIAAILSILSFLGITLFVKTRQNQKLQDDLSAAKKENLIHEISSEVEKEPINELVDEHNSYLHKRDNKS